MTIFAKSTMLAVWQGSELETQPSEVFYKKSCFQKFRNIHRKNVCWSPFLTKLQAFRRATFFKKGSYNTVVFLWIMRNFEIFSSCFWTCLWVQPIHSQILIKHFCWQENWVQNIFNPFCKITKMLYRLL